MCLVFEHIFKHVCMFEGYSTCLSIHFVWTCSKMLELLEYLSTIQTCFNIHVCLNTFKVVWSVLMIDSHVQTSSLQTQEASRYLGRTYIQNMCGHMHWFSEFNIALHIIRTKTFEMANMCWIERSHIFGHMFKHSNVFEYMCKYLNSLKQYWTRWAVRSKSTTTIILNIPPASMSDATHNNSA